ncbi:response regulator [Actinomadura chibensis]|uniref:Response regulator transcription factor n=1 Tax=Actinomadura chibensis TaxID=392828 RepID=A0A5D0NPI5_9ACTN|nr:response regulator transcription factor [Actinomadura chibensis]TYB46282.1 response regulator transcription factor [Actinomadura chibensis]
MTAGPPPRIRALVVEDNPIVRSGLVTLLRAADVEVVGEAVDGRHAIELAERLRPDIVLLDVRMPVLDGVAAAGPLSRVAKVLMLSYATDAGVIGDAIRNGASGYLVHGAFDMPELVAAIRDTVGGQASPLSPEASKAVVEAIRRTPPAGEPPPGRDEFDLTPRESTVMDLIARGRTNAEIARALVISEFTVKNHVNHIFAKLGVGTRGAAIARWLRTDESPPPTDP